MSLFCCGTSGESDYNDYLEFDQHVVPHVMQVSAMKQCLGGAKTTNARDV